MVENKVLIVYGTRYGATKGTAEEIGKILREEGFNTTVINLKEEKVRDISEYDDVIVGSGMKMERWVGKVDSFLKKFKTKLKKKKVVLFVSSGGLALMEYKGEDEEIKRIHKKYLEDKASKYELHPVSMKMFGGVWDFNQMGKIYRKFIEPEKKNFEGAGIKETKPGVYDSRDWDEVRKWVQNLAVKLTD